MLTILIISFYSHPRFHIVQCCWPSICLVRRRAHPVVLQAAHHLNGDHTVLGGAPARLFRPSTWRSEPPHRLRLPGAVCPTISSQVEFDALPHQIRVSTLLCGPLKYLLVPNVRTSSHLIPSTVTLRCVNVLVKLCASVLAYLQSRWSGAE